MSPNVKLLLIEQEMERFIRDDHAERERVHVDRVARILHLDSFGVSAH